MILETRRYKQTMEHGSKPRRLPSRIAITPFVGADEYGIDLQLSDEKGSSMTLRLNSEEVMALAWSIVWRMPAPTMLR